MNKVIGVKFKDSGKIYYFDPLELEIEKGGNVIVETARGLVFGEVAEPPRIIAEESIVAPLKPVVRVATDEDREQHEYYLSKEKEAFKTCQRKIEEHGLPVIPLADSDKLRLGEWVIAIGSPYDLRSTITAGIVSAKGRTMPNYSGEFKIESFIQTDAAVNPGNSGGALVNKEGQLVGVNTAIISQTGSYAGYSFAVPSNIVKRITDDLMDYGTVHRAMLGISMAPVDEEIARNLKLSSVNGVYIADVVKGSAAENAGLKVGDVLVEIGNVKITGSASVQEAVNSFHPGEKTAVKVIRDGSELSFDVVFK